MDYSKLSDKELLTSIDKFVAKEKGLTIEILKHLLIIQERRLFCELGFSSLFEYGVEHLGYSKSECYNRISAMNLLRQTRNAENKIERGTISLTNAKELMEKIRKEEERTGKAMSFLRKEELVEKIDGLSTRKAEQVLNLEFAEVEKAPVLKKLVLELDEETFKKFYKIKHLLGISKEVELVKTLLNEKEKILEKKEKEKEKEEIKEIPKAKKVESKSRYIPMQVKRELLKSADYRCEFISKLTGIRCEHRIKLNYEHCLLYSWGGKNEVSNLKILCVAHNQRSSIKSLGQSKMNQYLNKD